eukprot:CAMPEP_0197657864 /NCGR_PEP_ID=MMETSP1338-20131121/44889_1 /TAXON_ID=43686 ORGANISM="Pelagodinium beii, Strain RCC1491" /NCGR_SAMPLE_ID=MMETSP1338 /ASSEMBLY_ACC=CAM_ASM_000754 /LENGTH=610 /DNA_ID=CAMNT_0043234331 /DNA_START=47 /DNA_END=1877 /DNA_ORIENTATION=-
MLPRRRSSANGLAARLAQVKPVPASVQLLEKQLTSGEAKTRENGLDSITKIKPPTEPLLELIQKLLENQNWFVRRSASAAATRCAELEDAAQIIVHETAAARLDHEDEEVRTCAARALLAIIKSSLGERAPATAGLGVTRKVFGKEEETAEDDDFDDARSTDSDDSMFGVAPGGNIAPAVGQLAVEEIGMRLSSENPEVRRLSIECLNQLDAIAEPYASKLGKLIADKDIGVRNAAKYSFKVLGPYANGGAMNVAQLLWHGDPVIRKHALTTIHVIKSHSGSVAVEAVAKQFEIIEKSQTTAAEDRARKAAGKDKEKAFTTDRTSALRIIMTTLCEFGLLAAPYAKIIIEFLDLQDVRLRAVAVRCLICCGADAANHLKIIRKKLDHPDPDVRRAAVDVLRGLGPLSPIVANTMGKVLLEDASESDGNAMRQRVQVLRILGGSGKNAKKFLSDIARELESSDFQVRRAALEAFVDLEEHASSACVEISRRLLHADPVIRRAAVETIGRMGIHAGAYIGRVEALADTEEDPDVKNAVKAAMELTKHIARDDVASPKGAQSPEPKRRRSVGGVGSPASPSSPNPENDVQKSRSMEFETLVALASNGAQRRCS